VRPTCIARVLAILLALWPGAPRAAAWEAGGFIFSDELGGFRLLSVSGSGIASDPIVIVEEITELRPVTLIIRGAREAQPDDGNIPQRLFLYLAMIKVVINGTKRVWAGFDLELQQEITQPSTHGDGLSFAQIGGFEESFRSDRFAFNRQVYEPYDRVRFQEGSVDPGATVRLRFFVTDPTPVPEFYLLQDPQLLMARRRPPFESLANRPFSR
jgi:hypothetical protein